MYPRLLLHPLSLCAVLALAACQSTPPRHVGLEDARTAYLLASKDPTIAQKAQLELEKARAALAQADERWAKDHDVKEVDHLAYLARQRVAIANEAFLRREGEARVKEAGVERESTRADARAEEARQAKEQAAIATRQASLAEQRADQATAQALNLQAVLQELQAQQTARGMVLTLGDVLFDVGRNKLLPGAERTLDRLAEVMLKFPERRLLVEGFTDSSGSDSSNQALSERRTQAVRAALIDRGMLAERIDVRGYGKAYPVADNATAAGRQQNRRVEILISDEQGQFKVR
ncbi:OmpA family protein [Chitinimonas arctica]|uniref:OmpA family protein n=1 Tax=Chitinimonas arctica TaxID=2594795 RepID=A0A516SHB1_9NEIS|nr:OmpA family protein [Chitinimonas arctica]QDQ27553.1 OmpA family protein [Chitinimonas arctica]